MAPPFGSAPAIIAGAAIGGAASIALQPAFEPARQQAWFDNPHRLLDPGLLARLVAQGGVPLGEAADEARRDGYSADKLAALVYLAQTVPGIGASLSLWRRGLMSDALFAHVLVKEGLDQRYAAGIIASKTAEVLGIGDLAFAVVRGIVPAPSWVPVAPPTSGDRVPRFPVVDIDPIAEAAKLGYDEQAFRIMVGRSGLSLAPGLAANALFRDLIGPDDFLLAIAEGDLRTEWAETVRDVSRQVLTSHDAAELQLRGFLSPVQRLAYTDRHGMSHTESDLLYDLLGRSVNVHQVLIGERRGGVFNGPSNAIPPAYLQSLQRGNLRPEYYNLAYAGRETYPSYFVTRALLQGNVITPTRGRELFLGLGWPQDVAEAASTFYGGGTATSADPHVSKAQTQLWGTLHSSYIAEETDAALAETTLGTLGVAAAAIPQVLALWDAERALIRKRLTPAQIKKAYIEAVMNPDTGAPWTHDDALAALVSLGYSLADATTFLEL